jgi:4-amino-4-deoxychorismate lyase
MSLAPRSYAGQIFSETISSQDRGLLYGDGVFETVRCQHGRLILWDLHQQRLLSACCALGLTVERDDLDRMIADAIIQAPSSDCIMKVIVTRGVGGRGYAPPAAGMCTMLCQWHDLPVNFSENARQGIDLFVCRHPLSVNPVTAGIKHLNRLDQVLASRELSDVALQFPAVREGLMLDVDANLIEGTRSNVFMMLDEQLCTPALTRCGVDGVMRNHLLALFAAHGVDVAVRTIAYQEISLCSEVFVCNSVFGVWPALRLIDIHAHGREQLQQFQDTAMARMAQQWLNHEFPS